MDNGGSSEFGGLDRAKVGPIGPIIGAHMPNDMQRLGGLLRMLVQRHDYSTIERSR